MQVVTSSEQRSRYFHLTDSLKKVGKYMGRGKRKSIVKAILESRNL